MADYSDEELTAIIREGAAELGLTRILPMKTVSSTAARLESVSAVKESHHPVVRLVPSGR
jgi:hypothetical protein